MPKKKPSERDAPEGLCPGGCRRQSAANGHLRRDGRRDLNVNATRRLQHPDRNRPYEENPYTPIPIKPWLTAMATACSLFFAPSFRSAQKSNVSISLSLTPIRVAMS